MPFEVGELVFINSSEEILFKNNKNVGGLNFSDLGIYGIIKLVHANDEYASIQKLPGIMRRWYLSRYIRHADARECAMYAQCIINDDFGPLVNYAKTHLTK